MEEEQLLERNVISSGLGFAASNFTTYLYGKESVAFGDSADVIFTDASDDAALNSALMAAIALSVVIAGVCGLGVIVGVIFLMRRHLVLVRDALDAQERAGQARCEERIATLMQRLHGCKQDKIRDARDKAAKEALASAQLLSPKSSRVFVTAKAHDEDPNASSLATEMTP
ncbi:uncharacterized protein HaLaN_14932, partial [Haematococcus lacustris]